MTSKAPSNNEVRQQLDVLTRRERGRLIAGLVNRLGNEHLELAEDVAQEALLTALSIWPYRGTPDNPAAWLTRVARNKAFDRLRRENRELELDSTGDEWLIDEKPESSLEQIADPELRLVFLTSNQALEGADQIILTLRVVSGFTAKEIADIFLSTPDAIAQRLSRCKRKLKKLKYSLIESPTVFEIESHLPTVLKVVYLMFSLGYAPRSGSQLIRRDVAMEALRLSEELAAQKHTATPEVNALTALLCFQASRFEARVSDNGNPILMKDQDHSLWDKHLIQRGFGYLSMAMTDREVSRYHLEAGIASIYASSGSWEQIDWPLIMNHYARLVLTTDSPVVAINASVAQAFAGQPEQSLANLDGLRSNPILTRYSPYYVARAEILRLLGRIDEANENYVKAINCGASEPVIEYLELRLADSQ